LFSRPSLLTLLGGVAPAAQVKSEAALAPSLSATPAKTTARPAYVAEVEETFTKLRVRNRVPSRKDVDQMMAGKRWIDLDKLDSAAIVHARSVASDWVTGGMVNSVGSHETEGKRFKMFDIVSARGDGRVKVMLAGKAFDRYKADVAPKAVVFLRNAAPLPPNERFPGITLKVAELDSFLFIGSAMDMQPCSSITKAGKPCSNWVDARRTTVCNYHAATELKKISHKRSNIGGSRFAGPVGGQDRRHFPAGGTALLSPSFLFFLSFFFFFLSSFFF
jgi:hypothetical protein